MGPWLKRIKVEVYKIRPFLPPFASRSNVQFALAAIFVGGGVSFQRAFLFLGKVTNAVASLGYGCRRSGPRTAVGEVEEFRHVRHGGVSIG